MVHVGVNDARIERNRECAAELQNGKVRGTADSDFAAFHKINRGTARLDANVTAAAQNCFCLAVNDTHCNWPLDGNRIALDDADQLFRWLVGKNGAQAKRART